ASEATLLSKVQEIGTVVTEKLATVATKSEVDALTQQLAQHKTDTEQKLSSITVGRDRELDDDLMGWKSETEFYRDAIAFAQNPHGKLREKFHGEYQAKMEAIGYKNVVSTSDA